MHRRLVVRVLTLCAVSALVAGCAGSDGGSAAGDSVGATTLAPGATGTGVTTTIAPTTTFMADCATMPTAAAIGAAIGVPMGDGQVTGSGTCQYLGLNDQSKTVTLSLFTTAEDIAAFNDLQTSLGAAKAYAKIPGAKVGADSTLFVTANGATYAVLTLATDQPAAAQVPLSAAVLTEWLTL